MLVLDASIAIAWCFPDEATRETEALLGSVSDDEAHVPALWPYEVANVLTQCERRGRLPPDRTVEFIAMLNSLDIVVDRLSSAHVFRDVLSLARTHRLTSYDAAYLELALRLDLPLATRDVDLARAAREAGVTLVPA